MSEKRETVLGKKSMCFLSPTPTEYMQRAKSKRKESESRKRGLRKVF